MIVSGEQVPCVLRKQGLETALDSLIYKIYNEGASKD